MSSTASNGTVAAAPASVTATATPANAIATTASSIQSPRISVIFPVYNVEDYLALSIESIRNQTFQDLEIICVDDGTKDSSGELIDMYAKIDPRIKVIHKENGGLSSARNAGIKAATGEFICFLDSDDLLNYDACEKIVNAFEETGAEVVTYGGDPYPRAYGYPWLLDVLTPRNVVYDQFSPKILTKEKASPFAWRTACRNDFFQRTGIMFDTELPFGEDQVFHFAVYPRSAKTALIKDKLVFYRVSREGSLMFSRFTDKSERIRDHILIVEHILTDWENAGFLEQYKLEMFEWIVEFLIHDIFAGYEECHQQEVSARLTSVWRRFFPEEFLQKRSKNKSYGPVVSAVLNGDPRPSKSKLKQMLFQYYIWEYGLPHATHRSLSSIGRSIGTRLKPYIPWDDDEKQKDPDEDYRIQDWFTAWNEADEAARLEATENLKAEYAKCIAREAGSN